MNRTIRVWLGLLLVLARTGPFAPAAEPAPRAVEFNRDIRPLFADNCYACHGPDKNQRKADLRLDNEKSAFEDRGGSAAIVARKPEESEVYRRITERDPKKRMPLAKSGKQLSPKQIALIRQWIEEGALWQKHWSLIQPTRPELPEVADPTWSRTGIDRFILAQLEVERLRPSPEADRRTLIRRLSFDLTGLPPAPQDVDAFLADSSPTAYEKLVDRLLASKHYGERMAIFWLDLVRYADTGGYHSDNHRDVSLYRDYVLNAFNTNKRFDQFTIQQLAGDLLPNPTLEDKIASGYNRLLMTTEEGGAQAKEYLAKYAADRVRNASTVWLGTTLGCCECHDHKFDPFKTREFYRFAAFFADLKETPVGRQEQTRFPTPEQAVRLGEVEKEIAALRKVLDTQTPELDATLAKWEQEQKAQNPAAKPAPAKKDGMPADVAAALKVDAAKRTAAQKQAVAKYYRGIAPPLEPVRRKLAEIQRRKDALDKTILTTLISIPVSPRVMRVLPRGNWLDDSGEIVTPGTPASLPKLEVEGRRATRLDLARWLVRGDHPLTARVFVNRLWKLMFGQGLVTTLDDFGAQGAWPTHPELLDWLAVELIDSGWDVKHLLRLMALSATYRQSSHASEALRQRDPYNRLLARQARFRLDAETIRDNALAVSGLLSRQVGGPSVKPYQPAGYWQFLNFPVRDYVPDQGLNQHRRGLYTYWQRTFLHPSLLAFDAPSREECTVDRPRSNTPLQALVLLNDPTYVEAARALGERILRQGGSEVEQQIHFACRLVLSRKADPEELQLLVALYRRHLHQYQGDRAAAEALLHTGERPVPKDVEAANLAAWTSVARVLLNLHETITRS